MPKPRVKPSICALLTSELGFEDLEVTKVLTADAQLLRKVLPILVLLQERWPRVQSPKYIQALHGEMVGYFEIRVQIGKANHRIFFRSYELETRTLVLIAATSKIRRTGLAASTYDAVRQIWSAFLEAPEQASLLEKISLDRALGLPPVSDK